ncbi:MAG TPA: hypothetical protein VMB72_01285 [Acidimicrobiales bacterium]|nr:hypothetical protein [Acidimicrobiales bacterium]
MAHATGATLRVHRFADASVALERDARATFQCNGASGAFALRLTGIDVTLADGDSYLDRDLNFDLDVGSYEALVPVTQSVTTGLWQVGSDGRYVGTMPPSACAPGAPVTIVHDRLPGVNQVVAGTVVTPFELSGSL